METTDTGLHNVNPIRRNDTEEQSSTSTLLAQWDALWNYRRYTKKRRATNRLTCQDFSEAANAILEKLRADELPKGLQRPAPEAPYASFDMIQFSGEIRVALGAADARIARANDNALTQ